MIKNIILIYILCVNLYSNDIYYEEDKQLHFLGTTLVALSTTAILSNRGFSKTESFAYGVLAGVLVGVAKEAYDEYSYGGGSKRDMYADVAGSIFGSAISIQYDWIF